ncbi:GAD-like domain-containing protein [Variovorax ginsengisoli]|uniref:GAD-related domain-containing protein n=1 Tax=Variovorax ginsengisoli TaxID=363844 RepID=A0ABT9S2B3_9BURK|nr:GAD-like domain-containing protein [Variovorax ginsengisoli]MDP9898476.1 hypothetical protein [Variovorax ginsengisoli]
MVFFRRLILQDFVKTHPPSRQCVPASRELIRAYDGILPPSLLDLWRRKGLGFYGDQQLALIDPRLWQPVLDRWIISPPDAVRRIPIALTPLGVLLYYRKLTPVDEDVAFIDPVSKKTGELAWSLDEFFNQVLCKQELLEEIVSPALAQSARQQCGALVNGEVYEVDEMLLSMQMLRSAKVDALEMHRRLREAVDPPPAKAAEPTTVADALPVEYHPLFKDITRGQHWVGLYLSSYIDWYRLLALQPDGRYQLLFWRIHHKTFERIEKRLYSGRYAMARSSHGDEIVELDIALRKDSLGSDANDNRLVVMHSGGTNFLLRADELAGLAAAIGGRNLMGRSEYYFSQVALEDEWPDEPSDGRAAPAFAHLPLELQALIDVAPLRSRGGIDQCD